MPHLVNIACFFFCKFDDKYERLANQGIYFMHNRYEQIPVSTTHLSTVPIL